MSNRSLYSPAYRAVDLEKGGMHRIVGGMGTLVAGLAGNVWITQDDDRRDIVLGAGETFRIDRPGSAIVTALGGAATIAVLPQESARELAA